MQIVQPLPNRPLTALTIHGGDTVPAIFVTMVPPPKTVRVSCVVSPILCAVFAMLVTLRGAECERVWHNPNKIEVSLQPGSAVSSQGELRKAQQRCQKSAVYQFEV
jgi:hypothetical protein